jgi:predicted N-acyltransferase
MRATGSFEGFLGALASRKRKAIRREREEAQGFGGEIVRVTGDELEPRHWDAMWRFYQDTGARKWGHALSDARASSTSRPSGCKGRRAADPGGARGAAGGGGHEPDRARHALWPLLGRREHIPMMHFELCYYQAIDWALAHGLTRVEAGAQGEHKIARGYRPVICHSLHWDRGRAVPRAIADYLEREREAVGEEVEVLTSLGPFRREAREEQD